MMSHPTTRRDPMNDVMPFELLKVAHSLIQRKQDEAYWASTPVPKVPNGKLRFEVLFQVMTFAVPFLGLTWAWQNYALKGLLLALPVAWFVGYVLDKLLDRAIDAQQLRDEKRDAGRFRAAKWLCNQMGLRPEELTLDVIRKMDKDFVIVKRFIDEEWARRAKAGGATPQATGRRTSGRTAYARAVTAAACDDDWASPHTGMGFSPAVNPATALPMVEGAYVDVGGSVFGQDDNNF